MFKKMMILLFLFFLLPGSFAHADDFSDTLSRVEALNLSRGNYVLGKTLTETQRKIALKHPLDGATTGTYKFQDHNLTVVADQTTHKVVILYEHHKNAPAEKTRELIAALFMDFGDPTTVAHDHTVYWVFGPEGKLTREQYRTLRETKSNINVLATIKLNSSHRIMGKGPKENNKGDVYYIISAKVIAKYIKNHDR